MKTKFSVRFVYTTLFLLTVMLANTLETNAVPIFAVTDNNRLILFESSAPGNILSSVAITGMIPNETVQAIDFRPSTAELFAIGGSSRLYVINLTTGVATQRGFLVNDPSDTTMPFIALKSGAGNGLDFDPTTDAMRAVSDQEENLRINPANGQVITDTNLTFAAGDVNAGVHPRVTAAAFTNNVFGAASTTLYEIDTNLDILVLQQPPFVNGILHTVGPLGLNADFLIGFDIAPGLAPATAYAGVRSPSGSGPSVLYTINLATGAATLVGNIGGGHMIRALSIMPVVPNIYAVTVTNRLLQFSSASPGVILSNLQITGLQPGDSIIGIDFRPASGQLYGIGALNHIYTINTANGVATELTGGPAFTLTGTSFGVDFKPTADQIRVVSDLDQNLRLNPFPSSPGLIRVDSNLIYDPSDPNSGQDPNIVAAAYTNNFVGTTTTTLYDIDSNLDIVVRQGDPDTGITPGFDPETGSLFTLGELGVNVTDQAGLDIVAGSNVAYAALQPVGSPVSKLYLITLSSGSLAALANPVGDIGGGEIIRDISVAPQGTYQFSAQSYSVVEDCTGVDITVTRTGDLSHPASVDFATSNGFGFSVATDRADYNAAYGTLFFNPGESSKAFRVLINEDSFDEKLQGFQGELFFVSLKNPTNGFFVSGPTFVPVLIVDDAVEPATNAIDDTTTFVCQQYHDFLNRDPDAPGLAFWTGVINSCGGNAACVADKRIQVSAAFFLSIEFQETGYLVYLTYATAFGPTRIGGRVPLTLQEFLPDVQRIGRNVIVNSGDWQTQLEANKVAYFNEFVARRAFMSAFPATLTNAQYVDALNANAGGALSSTERDALVNGLNGGTETRATVLRKVADDADLKAAQFNRAFVLNQYFGYLRRDPNAPPDSNFSGYDFWLGKLNFFGGDFVKSEMVKAFITSGEYRGRFGQ